MGATRLCTTLSKSQADLAFARLEAVFEAYAYPLALSEIDETSQIYEIALYLEDEATAHAVMPVFCQAGGFLPEHVTIEALPDIDWVRHALDGLAPVRVRRFFVHGSHDRHKVQPHDMAIEIDAGQAFGTGHHGTTCGCLEMLERIIRCEQPRHIADIGTGSGVLAIAAAKRQKVRVLASDIDPIAVSVARDNIRRNGVSSSITTITAVGLRHRQFQHHAPFDLIMANILARPLMQLAPTLARHIRRGGSLILSGLLDSQRDGVLAAFRPHGLYHQASFHQQGWATLHLK